MIIYSEITKKDYETVEECLAAEREYKRMKVEEERKAAEKQAELDNAYEEAIAACEKYLELAGIKIDLEEEEKDTNYLLMELLDNFFE